MNPPDGLPTGKLNYSELEKLFDVVDWPKLSGPFVPHIVQMRAASNSPDSSVVVWLLVCPSLPDRLLGLILERAF